MNRDKFGSQGEGKAINECSAPLGTSLRLTDLQNSKDNAVECANLSSKLNMATKNLNMICVR